MSNSKMLEAGIWTTETILMQVYDVVSVWALQAVLAVFHSDPRPVCT